MWRLFLLFTCTTSIELFLLLQLGALLGPLETFAIIVVTGMLGAWLAKREGLGVLTALRDELQQGIPPGSRLAEGALVLAGGLLLVTPGVLTDITGFLFIIPFSRRWLAPRLVRWVLARFDLQVQTGAPRPSQTEDPHVRIRRERPRARPQAENPFASPFDDLP